jgi:O-antigen/teichoic acid export membrane protein
LLGPLAIKIFLGNGWISIIPYMRLLVLPMFVGSLISIIVPYLRSVGYPSAVTKATIVQFVVLGSIVLPLMHYFSVNGLILSNFIAGLAAFIYMFSEVNKIKKTY